MGHCDLSSKHWHCTTGAFVWTMCGPIYLPHLDEAVLGVIQDVAAFCVAVESAQLGGWRRGARQWGKTLHSGAGMGSWTMGYIDAPLNILTLPLCLPVPHFLPLTPWHGGPPMIMSTSPRQGMRMSARSPATNARISTGHSGMSLSRTQRS